MTAAEKLKRTYADYLRDEATSLEKHDFIQGEVFALAGGSLVHSALAASCVGELRQRLHGRPCVVFEGNARVRFEARDFACYPDATVVCGPIQRATDDPEAITNPVVIIEVLSPTTEAYDRGDKTWHYRGMPSVREVVLVSQGVRRVEVLRRNEAGRFEVFESSEGDVELASVGVTLPLAALYADADRVRALAAPVG